ncbi:MAG: DUF5320 domain-containing protein, partial [Candidatus Saliniplasma sp.]
AQPILICAIIINTTTHNSNKCDNMPRGDGTGPEGMGPMTGRGLGYCTGHSTPGFTKGPGRGLARGFGRGIGRGLGRGFRGGRRRFAPRREMIPVPVGMPRGPQQGTYYSGYDKEDEIEDLKDYAESLKRELEEVEGRLEELSKE